MKSNGQPDIKALPRIRAALDIGSNSIKLLVAAVDEHNHYRTLRDVSLVTGLGRGVSTSGELSAQAVNDTLTCIRELVHEARELGAVEIRAAGTAALRNALNPQALLRPLREQLQIEARVLSGDEEAQLSRDVALKELTRLNPGQAYLEAIFFDLGGGSTELTLIELRLASGPQVAESCSLPLGARRMTELSGLSQPVSPQAKAQLLESIRLQLELAPRPQSAHIPLLAGLGGTASVLVWIWQGLQGEARTDPHGAQLQLSWIEALLERLEPLSAEQVKALPYLDPLRADIIYAGASIIAAILRHYGAAEFQLLDRGLRYGLLLADWSAITQA
jgi:exopolyphosphatase/guanosine-5'-triphosphate,3'-diphosphate pyrophosphatase